MLKIINRKKIIAKIMVVAFCANTLPCVNAFAAEKSNVTTGNAVEIQNEKVTSESDFKFDAKTGTITGYTGTDSDVVVPSEIKGVKVTAIGSYAFHAMDSLLSITLPDSITSIEEYAFWYCDKLESVKMPKHLTSIGNGAFGECNSLKSISIPDSVTTISEMSFSHCHALKEVKMPASLKSIETYAFYKDEALSEVTLPNTLTTIGYNAFSVDANTRYNVSSKAVKDLLINNGILKESINSLLCVKDGIEFDAAIGTITNYTGTASELIVPSEINGVKVTSIDERAFKGNDSLVSVTLPDSITYIGEGAFWYCGKLENVKLPENLTAIELDTFGGCKSLKSVTIPDSVTTIGKMAFSTCDNLKEVKLPASLKSIGKYAFYQDWALEEITLPNTITDIGENAFFRNAETEFNVSSQAVKDLLLISGVKEVKINLVSDAK